MMDDMTGGRMVESQLYMYVLAIVQLLQFPLLAVTGTKSHTYLLMEIRVSCIVPSPEIDCFPSYH